MNSSRRFYKKMNKVMGVGINDLDEVVGRYVDGKWVINPYYKTWRSMLTRCYGELYSKKRVTYNGCVVCDEWIYLSNFKAWMEEQNWKGKQLDKDLLFEHNKLYSPETCVFVSSEVNSSLLLSSRIRGVNPVGVSFSESENRFIATCCNGKGKQVKLGRFSSNNDAHRAWQQYKLKLFITLQAKQTCSRTKAGLQRVIDKLTNHIEQGIETKSL